MQTQPETAVGSETTSVDAKADAKNAFENLAAEMLPDEEDDQPEAPPAEAGEGEQPEPDEEADDEPEGEVEGDDLPPIDPPVSWTAEEKAKFAELPRDLQETVQKRETDRERFVQSKSQEAARARSESEQAAMTQLAQIEREYAQRYAATAQQFDIPEPDIGLLATNPTEYAMQAHQHRAALAQRNEAQQAAQYYAAQAQQREAQAEQAFRAQEYQVIVSEFPEYADPTTGPKIVADLTAVARELGYPPELIEAARATDIMAMRKVAEYKAKAERLDRMEAKKMEKVRAAKGLPNVAKPGVAQGSDQVRQTRADAAWQSAVSSKGDARNDALADWMKNTGII